MAEKISFVVKLVKLVGQSQESVDSKAAPRPVSGSSKFTPDFSASFLQLHTPIVRLTLYTPRLPEHITTYGLYYSLYHNFYQRIMRATSYYISQLDQHCIEC